MSNKKREQHKQVFKTSEELVEYKREELYKIVPREKLKEILLNHRESLTSSHKQFFHQK
jgi:hypothetical protein